MKVNQSKTVYMVIAAVAVFYGGFFLVGKTGDSYLVAFYPLYVAIGLALLHNIKYRYPELKLVDPQYLLQEIKLGYSAVLVLIIISITFTSMKLLAPGILYAIYLFTLAVLANTIYIHRFVKHL